MIEVFTPYLLIFLSWNDLDPGPTMQTKQELYISQEICMKAGAETMKLVENDRRERLKRFKVDQIKTEASKFFCVPHLESIQKFRPLLDDN
ncbi:hypothetical protein [Parasphingorhabdus cellanae]|uniref:Uncharacterized protein n=1 Tax=Parasphingorhabdus cellanae TaxID=2806553 RepID=A0ABX7T4X2_9SPHN|nr:hypothetical protein [Parasphingorhabdus cellanae]QTD55968.1 hypothetical protein J4G78_17610 [Parasphingorhabdus cellanae]